jgi:hypothetical protein
VFKAFPSEWDEMLPFAELCRNNSHSQARSHSARPRSQVVACKSFGA